MNLSPMQAAPASGPGPVCEMCSQFVTDLRTWLQSEDGSDQVTATLDQVGRGSAGMILTIRVTNDPLVSRRPLLGGREIGTPMQFRVYLQWGQCLFSIVS